MSPPGDPPPPAHELWRAESCVPGPTRCIPLDRWDEGAAAPGDFPRGCGPPRSAEPSHHPSSLTRLSPHTRTLRSPTAFLDDLLFDQGPPRGTAALMLGGGGAQTSCAPTHRMPVHPAPPLGAPQQTPLAAPAWAMGGEGGPGPNGQVDGGQEVSALGGPASAGAGGPDSGADSGFPPSAPRPPHLADGGGSSSRSAMPPHAPSSRAAKLSTQERNREAQRRFRERQRTRVSALEAAAAEAAGREGVLRAELTAARARIAEFVARRGSRTKSNTK